MENKTKIVSSIPSGGVLLENTAYELGSLTKNISITGINNTTDYVFYNVTFTKTSRYTLTYPSDWHWANDDEPVFTDGTTYIINIDHNKVANFISYK